MDIGVFRASRVRLMVWIVVPPLLIVSLGLGTEALKRRSEWELNRTKEMTKILPKLIQMRERASDVLIEFKKGSEEQVIESEDQLISFLQEEAQQVGFTVDSIKVERRSSEVNPSISVLVASVKGTGSFDAIELYLGDVTTAHCLLCESAIKLSQVQEYNAGFYRAELAFELTLLHGSKGASGGVK